MMLWTRYGDLAGFRQIGHLGTLDPLATGVLVLLLGKATRLVRFYAGRRKRYDAGFRFGYATNTYDSEGVAAGPDTAPVLDRESIERLAAESVGRFEQMPPIFSAKKIHGRPAYELARKNQAGGTEACECGIVRIPIDGTGRMCGALLDRVFFGHIYSIAGARHGPEDRVRSALERDSADGGGGIFARTGD